MSLVSVRISEIDLSAFQSLLPAKINREIVARMNRVMNTLLAMAGLAVD